MYDQKRESSHFYKKTATGTISVPVAVKSVRECDLLDAYKVIIR